MQDAGLKAQASASVSRGLGNGCTTIGRKEEGKQKATGQAQESYTLLTAASPGPLFFPILLLFARPTLTSYLLLIST